MSINNFTESKNKVLRNLTQFENEFIVPLNNIEGLELSNELSEKIHNTYTKIEKDTFIIAMFGSFSDGKSTVVKAITGQENIEISPVPTTDKIEEYQYNHSFKIIDTPGLFSENKAHSEETVKYISEANLIIYMVDPINPLKDSQLEVVKWLVQDLEKRDSILFVINKMDSIADLEDEAEFEESEFIKKDVVYNTLLRLGTEIEKDNIIAIAADPYGEGLEYWQENLEEYKELSRIDKLMNKIDLFIEESREELIIRTGESVLKDCSNQLKHDLDKYLSARQEILKTEKSEMNYSKTKFNDFKKDVRDAHNNILSNIEEIRKEYILELNSINDEKELKTFFDLNLGEDFEVLNSKIEEVIRKRTESLLNMQENVILDIKNVSNSYKDKRYKILEMSGILGGGLSQSIKLVPVEKLTSGISIFRDMTNIPIKFKPWGMIKFAKNLKGAGALLGVIITGITTYISLTKQIKFDKKLEEIKDEISNYLREVKEILAYDEFILKYFPAILDFDEEVKAKNITIENQEIINMNIEKISNELEKYIKN